MDLPIGTVLLGKYRVEAVLGMGGMGAVVRASHLFLAQPVAIKVLLPAFAQDQQTVQRFLREAQSAVQLRGEHIARVHDVSTLDDGRPFMVMEYLEGADLNQILRAHGPQHPVVVADLMLQACEGISEAHALGITHRDLKPSNFFVTRMADGEMLLKILDFGISKSNAPDVTDLTGTQAVVGTPSYMAPEQMRTSRGADARSDQWSIGVVMYQLLTGRVPFDAENYADLVIKVATEPPAPVHISLPGGLGEIMLRCLEKSPEARYPNVAELARVLAPYSSDPVAGQRTAERVSRILNVRTGGPSLFGPNGEIQSPGGPQTPSPLSVRNWPGTNPSSLSAAGSGQVSRNYKAVTARRARWVPAAVIAGCVALGVCGALIHHALTTPEPLPTHVVSVPGPGIMAATSPGSAGSASVVISPPPPPTPPPQPPSAPVTPKPVSPTPAPPVTPVDAATPAPVPPLPPAPPVAIDAGVQAPNPPAPPDAALPMQPAPDAGVAAVPATDTVPPSHPTTPRKPFSGTPASTHNGNGNGNGSAAAPTTPKRHPKSGGDDLFDGRK